MAKKGKIKVKKSAQLRKKNEQPKDTLQKVQGRPPANNAATLKLKIRRK